MRASEITETTTSLKWATRNPSPKDYEIVMIDIKALMDNTNRIQKISLSAVTKADDENIIGDRVSRAKQFWLDGGEMRLSMVGYSDYSKMVDFTDGRHRLIAAYQLGERHAPVLADKDGIEEFKALVGA